MNDKNINLLEDNLGFGNLLKLISLVTIIVLVSGVIWIWLKANKQKVISDCQQQASQSAKAYTGACTRCLEDNNIMDADNYCHLKQ